MIVKGAAVSASGHVSAPGALGPPRTLGSGEGCAWACSDSQVTWREAPESHRPQLAIDDPLLSCVCSLSLLYLQSFSGRQRVPSP